MRTSLLAVLLLLACAARPVSAQPDRTYRAIVVGEAADAVTVVSFGPDGAGVDRTYRTGPNPTEIDGPHGVDVAPDGLHYFVSLGHGNPNGSLWKHRTGDDRLEGRVELGLFPATLDVTPDGARVFVVNFNLHGDPGPSSVSVVDAGAMLEVARIPTCAMPHGSRLTPDGSRHYSVCMMDDLLVEIDASTLAVSRHLHLGRRRGEGGRGIPALAPDSGPPTCRPTWAQPSADGQAVYVACHGTNEIIEVDAATWSPRRVIEAGDGVYNLAATRDGRLLVATNKRGASVSLIDLDSGRETARLPTQRSVVHGVAVSRDDRYAFVSVEGRGAEPGTVEIVDLEAARIVARVDVPYQAAGIDILPSTQ